MSFEITANHAHVFPKSIREDGTVDNLLRYMDDLNISKSVCFATLPVHLKPDNEETNAWLYKELKGKDRLVGFGAIDFEKDDVRSQVDRIADYGFKGIKIHPALQHIRVDGEKAFEVYEQAEKYGLFITFHSGLHWARVYDYLPWRFDEVAYHFPGYVRPCFYLLFHCSPLSFGCGMERLLLKRLLQTQYDRVQQPLSDL